MRLSLSTTDVARYDATDEDPTDTTFTFSLAGADKDLFNLRDTTDAEESASPPTPPTAPPTTRQVLEFKEKPDYEVPTDANKDNVYEVTVQVFDGEDTTTKDVTVKVTNMQEDGKVEVTPLQARIGIDMTADLTDSDIVAHGPTWRWWRSAPSCTDKDDCNRTRVDDHTRRQFGHLHAAFQRPGLLPACGGDVQRRLPRGYCSPRRLTQQPRRHWTLHGR